MRHDAKGGTSPSRRAERPLPPRTRPPAPIFSESGEA
jgi:hypothetical protein